MNNLSIEPADIKRQLTEPWPVLRALGLDEGARRQARGALVRCPWHAERTPSCSVRQAGDGTLGAHCFGCGSGGDVLALVAAVRGLDPRRDFRRVLAEAADLAGTSVPQQGRRPASARPASSGPGYPADAAGVWARCAALSEHPELCAAVRARRIDAAAVEAYDLARALALSALPRWCASWSHSGHRLVLPLYDARGVLRSLHGRTLATDLPEGTPKGRFPTGHTSRGLVLADAMVVRLLQSGAPPAFWTGELILVEGATDYLTLAARWSDAAVSVPATVGLVSGSWSGELAQRIPSGTAVRIWTHPDEAGRRYAAKARETLGHCTVRVEGGPQ